MKRSEWFRRFAAGLVGLLAVPYALGATVLQRAGAVRSGAVKGRDADECADLLREYQELALLVQQHDELELRRKYIIRADRSSFTPIDLEPFPPGVYERQSWLRHRLREDYGVTGSLLRPGCVPMPAPPVPTIQNPEVSWNKDRVLCDLERIVARERGLMLDMLEPGGS